MTGTATLLTDQLDAVIADGDRGVRRPSAAEPRVPRPGPPAGRRGHLQLADRRATRRVDQPWQRVEAL